MQNKDCLLKIVGYAHLMWCEDRPKKPEPLNNCVGKLYDIFKRHKDPFIYYDDDNQTDVGFAKMMIDNASDCDHCMYYCELIKFGYLV